MTTINKGNTAMTTINGRTRKTTTIKSHIADFYYRGYHDFQSGVSYNDNKEYDTWRERDQKNYEIGRLHACEGNGIPDIIIKKTPKATRVKVEIAKLIGEVVL